MILTELKNTSPPLERLREIADSRDPVLTHALLEHLERRLAAEPNLATLLPNTLTGLAPETQCLAARVYRLVGFSRPLPEMKLDELAPGVQVAWVQTGLARDADFPATPQLLRAAVEGLDWATIREPEILLRRLGPLAVAPLLHLVKRGWVPLRQGRELLLSLPDCEALLWALRQPCFALRELPVARLKGLLDGPLAASALRTLAAWPDHSPLREVLHGTHDPRRKREAVELLNAEAGDIAILLELALDDPPFYAAAVLRCLRDLRRRDVSLEGVQLVDLFRLSLEGADLDAAALAEVLRGRWTGWLRHLRDLSPDDPSWPLQIDVLERANQTTTTAFLIGLLGSRSYLPIVLLALGRLQCREVEQTVLDLFDEAPEEAAEALKRLGGERTIEAMLSRMQNAANRRQALNVLLALSPASPELLDLLDPAELSATDLHRLRAAPDPGLQHLLEEVAHEAGHPGRLAAIERLGSELPLELLGDDNPEVRIATGKLVTADRLMTALEQTQSPEVRRRLFEQLVPLSHARLARFLRGWRKTADPQVRKFVIQCTGRSRDPRDAQWLLSLTRSSEVTDVRWALEALGQQEAYWLAPGIAALLEHPNMNVKKTAAEALLRAGTVAIVPRLVAWLRRHDNPGLRTALLSALAKILGGFDTAVLLDEVASQPSDSQLLLNALEGKLDVVAIAHMVRRNEPFAEVLAAGIEVKPLLERWGLQTPLPGISDLSETLPDLLRRPDLLDVLPDRLPQLETAEKISVVAALRQSLAAGVLDFQRTLELMRQAGAVLTAEEARLASKVFPVWALESGCSLEQETVLGALRDGPAPKLVAYAIEQGWMADILPIALSGNFLRQVRQAWTGPPPVELLLQFTDRTEVLDWLATAEDDRIDRLMLGLLEDSFGHARQAVSYLSSRRSARIEERVRTLFQSRPSELIGELLVRWGGPSNREAVIEALLSGGLRYSSLRATAAELRLLEGRAVTAPYLKLMAQSGAGAGALWGLRERVADVDQESYRHLLRSLPPEQLLPFLEDDLQAGRWQVLECLGWVDPVPPKILSRLRAADKDEQEAWLEFLGQRSGLRGHGLGEILLELAGGAHRGLALDLYARMPERAVPGSGGLYLTSFKPFLPAARDALLKGLRALPAREEMELLSELDGVTERMSELYLDTPSLKETLSEEALLQVLQRVLGMTQDRNPERARQALRLVLQDQPEQAEEALETALEHPESRVRSLAHRLLQSQVSKERYLEVTLRVLRDPVPEFRRRAIRVLSFARFLPAVPGIAKLLWDKKKAVDRAARHGLIYIGEPALPALRGVLARTRPDQRPVLLEVVQTIESYAQDQRIAQNFRDREPAETYHPER